MNSMRPPVLKFGPMQPVFEILSIDPGYATGWSYWLVTPDRPAERITYGLVPGGIEGIVDWMNGDGGVYFLDADYILLEKFKQEGRAADFVGAHVEAVIRGEIHRRGLVPAILRPNSAKSSARDQILKDGGIWVENSDVNWTDARDVNDSQIHALGWLKENGHMPTALRYWPDRNVRNA